MKVPPKRKGNLDASGAVGLVHVALNESPSEKEGKSALKDLESLGFITPLNESPSEKEGK